MTKVVGSDKLLESLVSFLSSGSDQRTPVMNLNSLKETALIGHTGFVGSNLLKQTSFAQTFNSVNFLDMGNRHFELIVCAGISAAKWLANREPEADRAAIQKLQNVLKTVKADRFILISTIDVYKNPHSVTEKDIPTTDGHHAYGAHRYEFEQFVHSNFKDVLTLRLPALFGPGLKKNAIYDLMNDNNVSQIDPAGDFQWYPVDRLWTDITAAAKADLELFNITTEPFQTATIVEHFFPRVKLSPKPGPAASYDMWSLYAEQFGGKGHYLMNKESVLQSMASYIQANSHACI